MDADGQLPHHKIPSFIKTIKKGAAVVIGKRSVIPRFTEKLLANFSSLIYGIDDPFCGMKAYDLNANPQTKLFLVLVQGRSFQSKVVRK